MTKVRLEAFTDGVLAVAITLLVLDLHLEPGNGESLLDQVLASGPSFAAYVDLDAEGQASVTYAAATLQKDESKAWMQTVHFPVAGDVVQVNKYVWNHIQHAAAGITPPRPRAIAPQATSRSRGTSSSASNHYIQPQVTYSIRGSRTRFF